MLIKQVDHPFRNQMTIGAGPQIVTSRDMTIALNHFERAWMDGAPPDIQIFIDGVDNPQLRHQLCFELVAMDIEFRWRRAAGGGQTQDAPPWQVETYLQTYPELEVVPDATVHLICEEYRARHRWGDHPPHEDYEARFPNLRQRIRDALTKLDIDASQQLLETQSGIEVFDGTVPNTHDALVSLPEQLGNYRLVEQIGAGGMGRVYKAYHTRMDRVVAIKVPPPESLSAIESVKRFDREIKAVAKLTHPNIVVAHDADEANGVHFLVMEYIEGEDLAALVKQKGPISARQAVDFVLQAANGLSYAHRKGIIHRDIKPSNLLLEKDGTVKVLDMGLALLEPTQHDVAELTATGAVMGTVDYMSPEQALDTKQADARSDIYSLGCTLFHLLTGEGPYSKGSITQRILAHREQTIPSLRDRCPDASPELGQVLEKTLAKLPEDRFQTMDEVIAALSSLPETGAVEHANRPLGATSAAPNPQPLIPVTRGPLVASLSLLAIGLLFAFWAVGIIFKVETPEGTVIVEIDGSGKPVEVRVAEDKTITIVDPNDGQEIKVTVDREKKQLKLDKQGFELAVRSFSLDTRDGRKIQVKFEPMPDARPQATVVDLLGLIDPEEHTIRNGRWRREAGVLKSPLVEQKYSIIEIPYYAPEEYDLTMRVERVSPLPEVLGIGLWVRDRHVVAVIDGWTGRASGLEVLDGQNASANATTVKRRLIGTKTPQTITCQVRKDSIEIAIDGESVIDWQGNINRFSAPIPQWRIPFSRNLYVGVNSAEYHFHEITLSPRSSIRDPDKRGYRFPDPDLRAAEWALSLGGRIQYELARRRQSIDHIGQLPDAPFRLIEMDLRRTDAEGWEYVVTEGLQYLEKLILSSRHGQSDAFASIVRLKCLRELDLQSKVGADEVVTPQVIAELRVALPNSLIKWTGGEDNPSWHGWPSDAPSPANSPFDAQQGKQHQELWAEYLGVPVEYTNSIGMKFRLIPPGEFMMGSRPDEIDALLEIAGEDEVWRQRIESESPQHKVILTRPVYLGFTEVTQAQYQQVMGTSPSHFSKLGEGKDAVVDVDTSQHPVESVRWVDAAEFCTKLSQREERKPWYSRSGDTIEPLDGTGYRLPTEAEWEFACCAGATMRFWNGEEESDVMKVAWSAKNSSSRSHKVAELPGNGFGLFDVHGNVWEWVQDGWDARFYANDLNVAVINPSNSFSANSLRIIRGGSWGDESIYLRSANRVFAEPIHRDKIIGFRVLLMIDDPNDRNPHPDE